MVVVVTLRVQYYNSKNNRQREPHARKLMGTQKLKIQRFEKYIVKKKVVGTQCMGSPPLKKMVGTRPAVPTMIYALEYSYIQ